MPTHFIQISHRSSSILTNNTTPPTNSYTLLSYLTPLIHATYHLYQHHLIHLDIKPSNILYHPVNHHVLLIDFGLTTSRSTPYSTHGTPEFSPPASFQHDRPLPNNFDLWSIGCVILDTLFAHNNQSWFVHMSSPPVQSTIFTKLQQTCPATPAFQTLFSCLQHLFHPTTPPDFITLLQLLHSSIPTSIRFDTVSPPLHPTLTPERSHFLQQYYQLSIHTFPLVNIKSIYLLGCHLYDSLPLQFHQQHPLLPQALYYITYFIYSVWSDPLPTIPTETQHLMRSILHQLQYHCYLPTAIDFLLQETTLPYADIHLPHFVTILDTLPTYSQYSLSLTYLQHHK